MEDLAGTRIGQYQILEEVGRGGMAQVYRAWQPSLERFVALKVLPPYMVHDKQFLARFQREARAAARLSHPNIVHIYDTGVAHGTERLAGASLHYIAMEYLAGGSLTDLLAEGPLDPGQAGGILAQVASALDYAHDQGLIHRDVKPANILFADDKRPKVTDFGIAYAADGTQLTRTGIVMGTPEYMAPEQAEGRAVDYRADLYALGVVLYQMLTGRAPFRGTTPHATLHAVIYEAPPPPRQINPGLPAAVEKVVLKALAKRPEERFQRGADMAVALEAALPPTAQPAGARTPTRPAAVPAQRRSALPLILAGIAVVVALCLVGLLALAGSGVLGGRSTPTPDDIVAAASSTRPAPTLTPVSATATLALAEQTITVSPLPATDTPILLTQTPSAPTEAAQLPSDTPVPATATLEAPTQPPTEEPTEVPTQPPTQPPPPTDPPPARFGRLAFSSQRDGNPEIYVVDLAGGGPRRLTNNNSIDWLPDWSPDGTQLAHTSNRRAGNYDSWAMDDDGGRARPLVATAAWDDYPRWSPDGRRLALSTTAKTQGIDNSEVHVLEANGNLVRITQTVAEDQWPDWSPDGRLIYTEGFKGTSDWDLYVSNADGSNRQLWLGGPSCDVQPTWSPDGQWVAFIRMSHDANGNGQFDEEDAGDVWVARSNGTNLRQLTSGVWAVTPAWSPDSQWIAYAQILDSNANGRKDLSDDADIWAVPLAGGSVTSLVAGPHRDGDPTWTW